MKKVYLVYDERAAFGDTDDALVMVACESLEEARGYAGVYGAQCPVYSYDEKENELVNEEFVELI